MSHAIDRILSLIGIKSYQPPEEGEELAYDSNAISFKAETTHIDIPEGKIGKEEEAVKKVGSTKYYELKKDRTKAQIYQEGTKPWHKTSSEIVSFLQGVSFVLPGYYPLANYRGAIKSSGNISWISNGDQTKPGYGTLIAPGITQHNVPKCIGAVICGGGGGGCGHSWFYSGSGGGGGGAVACVLDLSVDTYYCSIGGGGGTSYDTGGNQTSGGASFIRPASVESYLYAGGGGAALGNANWTHGSGGAGGSCWMSGSYWSSNILEKDGIKYIYLVSSANGGNGGSGENGSGYGGYASGTITLGLGGYSEDDKEWSSQGGGGGSGSYGGGGGASPLGNGGYGAGKGGNGGGGGAYGGGGGGGGRKLFSKGYGGNGASGAVYLFW